MNNYRIPYAQPFLPGRTKEALISTFDTGQISGRGDALRELESRLQTQLDSSKILAVSNGSAAIQLAFLAIGIRPGSRVIAPGWGFHVAANIAHSMGAEIEFRDVSSESWCLELEELSDISDAKDAVVLVLVHTLGNSSNLEHASRFKRNQNIKIIEDAAEAYMSKSGDDYLGTIFDIGTYSMHAAKTITTGEGGFLSSNRLELNEPLELLRNHGMSPTRPYFHELPGSNFRLSNLLASLAHPQLDAIEQILLERKDIYDTYVEELGNIEGVSFLNKTDPEGFFPWGVCVRVKDTREGHIQRLRNLLSENSIDTRPGFTSAEQLPYFNKTHKAKQKPLPVSNALSRETILLPHYPGLKKTDVLTICQIISSFIASEKNR